MHARSDDFSRTATGSWFGRSVNCASWGRTVLTFRNRLYFLSAVAHRLSDLAKMVWPGSVKALQLTARPVDMPRLRGVQAPGTWSEATECAECLLDAHFTEAAAHGLDSEGWADTPRRASADFTPERVFAEALAALDAVLTSNGSPPDLDDESVAMLGSAARECLLALRARSVVRTGGQAAAARGSVPGQIGG